MQWPQLREDVTATTARAAALLRAAPDPSAPVPGLDWTVRDVGAHLVTVATRFRRMLVEHVPMAPSIAAYNEALMDELGPRTAAELADLLEAETRALLADLGDDPERVVPFFETHHTVAGCASALLSEVAVHGLDLARAVRQPWTVPREQAIAIADGILPMLYRFVDPAAAERAAGTYHLHLRGDGDWTIEVRDRAVRFERGRPAQADVHLSADPVAYLLVGFQRMSRVRALLTGRMLAWGRRPWLSLRLARVFVES